MRLFDQRLSRWSFMVGAVTGLMLCTGLTTPVMATNTCRDPDDPPVTVVSNDSVSVGEVFTVDATVAPYAPPAYASVCTKITAAIYGGSFSDSFIGFTLDRLDEGVYQVHLVDAEAGTDLESSAIAYVQAAYDLPAMTDGLATAYAEYAVSMNTTAHVIAVDWTRNDQDIAVCGLLLDSDVDPAVGMPSNHASVFVPLGVSSDMDGAVTAGKVMAATLEGQGSVGGPAAPEDNTECIAGCMDTCQLCHNRAQEDWQTAGYRCQRNFAMRLAGCMGTLFSVPFAMLVCVVAVTVWFVVCCEDADKDRDTTLRRCDQDEVNCLRGCGAIIADD